MIQWGNIVISKNVKEKQADNNINTNNDNNNNNEYK